VSAAGGTHGGGAAAGGGRRLAAGLLVASLLVLVAGLFVQRWWARASARERARPVLSGTLAVPGLAAPAQVLRGGRGVPHVLARDAADGWRSLGLVHAQDRPEQLLWLRRLARGRTAERIGAQGVPADRLVRTLGIGRLADRDVGELEPAVRDVLAAYADGVNARLARLPARPGAAPGPPAPPEPWRPADSLAVYKLLSWAMSSSLDAGLLLDVLVGRLGGVGSRPFFPASGPVEALRLPLDPIAEGGPRVPDSRGLRPEALEVARLDGSAWVLPGGAASGGPLFGVELGLAALAPALVHEVRLTAGGLDVVGVAVPGVPLFFAGRSQRAAWAVLPARAAATDLFDETLRGDRYHDGSRWRPLRVRETSLRVAGPEGVEERALRVRSTRNGPLFDPGTGAGPVSVAWTGALPGAGPGSLMGLARAESAAGARELLLEHRDPPVVVVFADRKGGRGVQLAGWLPQRVLPTSLVPVPGRMRAFRWRDPVAPDLLPGRWMQGPDGPAVWSADEPWPEGHGPQRVEWLWRRGRRAARLESVLERARREGGVELEAAASWWRDVRPAGGEALRDALLTLAEGLDPGRAGHEVREMLAGWDGSLEAHSAGGLALRVLLHHLSDAVLAPEIGGELLDALERVPAADPSLVVAAAVLASGEGAASGAWADPGRLRPALRDALESTGVTLSFRLGPRRARWRWGELHRVRFHAWPGPGPSAQPEADHPLGGSGDTLFRSEAEPGGFRSARISAYQAVADLSADPGDPRGWRSVLASPPAEDRRAAGPGAGVGAWRAGRLAPAPGAAGPDEEPEEPLRLRLEPAR